MHTMSNLVCGRLFNTHYKAILKKGTKVWIPVFTAGASTEVTPGTEPTAVDKSTTAMSITVDQWYQNAAEISDLMEIEEEADYMAGAAKSCAYTIAQDIDTYIGAIFPSLGGYNGSAAYGSDGQTFTDDIFIYLVETLDEADVPSEGRFLIGDPSTRADMYKIDKFVRTDYVRETVPTGQIGSLYGASVHITNNLTPVSTGNYGVYSHPDSIGVVIQKEPRSRAYDMSYKFITKIIVDAAWGAAEIRDTFACPFYTRYDA